MNLASGRARGLPAWWMPWGDGEVKVPGSGVESLVGEPVEALGPVPVVLGEQFHGAPGIGALDAGGDIVSCKRLADHA